MSTGTCSTHTGNERVRKPSVLFDASASAISGRSAFAGSPRAQSAFRTHSVYMSTGCTGRQLRVCTAMHQCESKDITSRIQ